MRKLDFWQVFIHNISKMLFYYMFTEHGTIDNKANP